jgi:N-acetylated-alpha-linked acidic dipeptidase
MKRLTAVSLVMVLISAVPVFGQDAIRGFPAEQVTAQREREQQARLLPSPDKLRAHMEKMASAPHVAGSAGSRKVAEYALKQFKSWGLDAEIETLESLIPYPTVRLLETMGTAPFRAKLTEPPLAEDPDTAAQDQIATFNAYSASGDVTAPLVYVNYGTPEDYAQLDAQGISVKGKIVIARYGRTWRGIKPKLAQDHGAVGCIMYSDPRDDGFFVDEVYPSGPMRPAEGVQRGSVMDMAIYTGDPLTPGWASEPGAPRLSRDQARTLLKIPVLPISWTDARPFLELLEGPIAPESWRGALPITYHVGPSTVSAHLKLDFDWTDKPLHNVIATIPGSSQKDQWIIYGNHHDAWVTGASDPVSGAAALLETARVLATLVKEGWKPQRTIKLVLWDGEEYGLLGSTEWVEKHAQELRDAGAVYLNTDSSGTGPMSVAGSWSLERFVDEVLRDVNDPRNGKSLLENMNQSFFGQPPRPNQVLPDVPIGSLGSGSDYVAFLHHLGIASLNFGFGAAPGQYHSNYDTVRFYNAHSDGDRRYGVALTQVMTTAILRLADAPAMPFSFISVAETVARQAEEVRSQVPQGVGADFDPLLREIGRFGAAARAFETAYAGAAAATSANVAIERVERAFLLPEGLPGREWYQHSLYAPGLLTGYSAKTLPGIREAFEAKDWAAVNSAAQRLAGVLRSVVAQIELATQALK